jgi:hypothetical protein
MDTGLQMRSAGLDFKSTAQSLVSAIDAMEKGNPWGRDDDYAKAFLENYHGKGKEFFNEALKKALPDMADALTRIGDTLVQAMAKYQTVDSDSANQIGSTTDTQA